MMTLIPLVGSSTSLEDFKRLREQWKLAEPNRAYRCTKTYEHSIGLSTCFRQWRASSHCRFLHGYPLSVKLTFQTVVLDDNNWVIDFGGLKQIKSFLTETFDHKTLVASDDPQLEFFVEMQERGLVDLLVVPSIGVEMFARLIFEVVSEWLAQKPAQARLLEVEVREHGANGASYGVYHGA